MRPVGVTVRRALLPALCVTAAQAVAAPVEIQHEPLACVPAARFVSVVAQASPPERVLRAELQFRVDPQGAWYAIPMRKLPGGWSALLPRATRSLARFEYWIVMAGRGFADLHSPVFSVRVSDDPAGCGVQGEASVDASIVVRVPKGAPIAPPVPAGYDPAGVVAAPEREPARSRGLLPLLGGLGATALVTGVAVAAVPGDRPPLPIFRLGAIYPDTGSTISLSRDQPWVSVWMDPPPTSPLDLTWRVTWSRSATEPACVSMEGVIARTLEDPFLSAPLSAAGFCGDNFGTSWLEIRIDAQGRGGVYHLAYPAPYQFEP